MYRTAYIKVHFYTEYVIFFVTIQRVSKFSEKIRKISVTVQVAPIFLQFKAKNMSLQV
jgi:hypothetical protein